MTYQMFNPQPNYSGVTIQILNPSVNTGIPNNVCSGCSSVYPGYITANTPQNISYNNGNYVNGFGNKFAQYPQYSQYPQYLQYPENSANINMYSDKYQGEPYYVPQGENHRTVAMFTTTSQNSDENALNGSANNEHIQNYNNEVNSQYAAAPNQNSAGAVRSVYMMTTKTDSDNNSGTNGENSAYNKEFSQNYNNEVNSQYAAAPNQNSAGAVRSAYMMTTKTDSDNNSGTNGENSAYNREFSQNYNNEINSQYAAAPNQNSAGAVRSAYMMTTKTESDNNGYPSAYPAQYYINNYGTNTNQPKSEKITGSDNEKNKNVNNESGYYKTNGNYSDNRNDNLYRTNNNDYTNNNKNNGTNNESYKTEFRNNEYSSDVIKNNREYREKDRNNSYVQKENYSSKQVANQNDRINSSRNYADNTGNNYQTYGNFGYENYDENIPSASKMNDYSMFADRNEQKPESDMMTSTAIINNLNERDAEIQEEKKNTKETKIVGLTDEYIKSLENYLNNPNEEIRLMASKEILTRLDEDHDRYNDAALNALLNKMLQDPAKLVRIASLSAFASQLASGNNYTVQLLHNIQANPNADKEDVLQAADILLKMSAGVEIKNIPNPAAKETPQNKKGN